MKNINSIVNMSKKEIDIVCGGSRIDDYLEGIGVGFIGIVVALVLQKILKLR